MKQKSYKIFSLGVDALTIEFGSEISLELNEKAVNLSKYFEKNRFAGFIETVPAYASLTVFFDAFEVGKNFPEHETAFAAVSDVIEKALGNFSKITKKKPRVVEIPVNFDKRCALDLDFVASLNNLTPARVVEIFTSHAYRVFMLGFLPAFAYMGEVDARIAAPRKESPRLVVPRGSVGIAGRQTGIYPFASPGGWQIIGKTDFELFTPDKKKPCALEAGDLVKFYAV